MAALVIDWAHFFIIKQKNYNITAYFELEYMIHVISDET